MNLKNTIDNTNKYKNDLKIARNKINDRIISGGGSIANTISDVPNAIDEMLKQYKKIAMGELNYSKNFVSYRNNDVSIPVNFNASRIIVRFVKSNYKDDRNFCYTCTFDTQKRAVAAKEDAFALDRNGDWIRGTSTVVNGNTLRFYMSSGYNTSASLYLLDWIAIE